MKENIRYVFLVEVFTKFRYSSITLISSKSNVLGAAIVLPI